MPGKEAREIAFRIRCDPARVPIIEFDEDSGVTGPANSVYFPEIQGAQSTVLFVSVFYCAPGTKKTNIRVRDPYNLWNVEFRNVSLQSGERTRIEVRDAVQSAPPQAKAPSAQGAVEKGPAQ
jgi:hypothetical protein